MAGNDVQFSLEQIQQLNVKQLQAFLRERGLKTVGRKAELQALAFSAVQLGYKVKQTEVEEDRLRSDQYAELLNIEGKRIPDPLVEINNWISLVIICVMFLLTGEVSLKTQQEKSILNKANNISGL